MISPPPLDRLIRDKLLTGKRFGLLSHQAAVSPEGQNTLQCLMRNQLVPVRLFTPEHGFYAAAQDHEQVPNQTIQKIPAHSLYGDSPDSLHPAPEHLEDLDTLVVDLMDIGTRYYTYTATAWYASRAAREAGLEIIILDRPNPLGGKRVEGPVLPEEMNSFVGAFPVPVRHGMTAGELLNFASRRVTPSLNHQVITLQGYRRETRFADTGFPWVPPSPNMPSPATALLYPGMCLLEATNISEGRGTTSPFSLAGAPFIDPEALVRELNALNLPGVVYHSHSFLPRFQKWAGTLCHGTYIRVTDPISFPSFAAGVHLLAVFFRRYGSHVTWRSAPYEFVHDIPAIDLLTGSSTLRHLLENGDSVEEYLKDAEREAKAFREEVRQDLIYD